MQCADLGVTASLCIVVLVCTSFLTIVKTPEVPVKSIQCCCDNPHATSKIDHPNDADIAGLALVKKIFQMLGVMPRAMVRVCAFQFLAWWSWSYQILFAGSHNARKEDSLYLAFFGPEVKTRLSPCLELSV